MNLKTAVALHGWGLHTGREARLVLEPLPVGRGLIVRTGAGDVPLRNMERDGARRCTRLLHRESDYSLMGVEHLLAALSGLGIWDARIVAAGEEVPVMDGSARPFVDALIEGCDDTLPGSPVSPTRIVRVEHEEAFIEASPHHELVLDVSVQFEHEFVGPQRFCWSRSRDFTSELAPARTFGFETEVSRLREEGLALGGGLDCALVFGDDGILNPEGARFDDEPVRHKTLDLLGDLALLGRPLAARVRAHRPGHALSHRMVAALVGALA